MLGNLAVLRAGLPALRASKGRVVRIWSIIGQFAWPASGLYTASKGTIS